MVRAGARHEPVARQGNATPHRKFLKLRFRILLGLHRCPGIQRPAPHDKAPHRLNPPIDIDGSHQAFDNISKDGFVRRDVHAALRSDMRGNIQVARDIGKRRLPCRRMESQ